MLIIKLLQNVNDFKQTSYKLWAMLFHKIIVLGLIRVFWLLEWVPSIKLVTFYRTTKFLIF